jgi:hypothetical protein
VLQVWPSFERTVVAGIVMKRDGCGIMRVIENFQIFALGILRVAEKKSVAVGFENSLPDFVVSLGHCCSKKVVEC